MGKGGARPLLFEAACLPGFNAARCLLFNCWFYYLPDVGFNVEENVTTANSLLCLKKISHWWLSYCSFHNTDKESQVTPFVMFSSESPAPILLETWQACVGSMQFLHDSVSQRPVPGSYFGSCAVGEHVPCVLVSEWGEEKGKAWKSAVLLRINVESLCIKVICNEV